MRILVSVEYFYPPYGGAEVSLFTLLKKLAEKHEIFVLYSGKERRKFRINSIDITSVSVPKTKLRGGWVKWFFYLKQWEKIIIKAIRQIKPDLILTQLNFSSPTAKIAEKFKIPLILFLRSYEHFCPLGFANRGDYNCKRKCWDCMPTWKDKLQYIFIMKIMKEHKFAVENADLILANSKYVYRVCKKWYDIDSEVIYPFIVLTDYIKQKPESQRGYITFINPIKHKGLDIFIRVAERMRTEKFLVVGGEHEAEWFKKNNEIKVFKHIQYVLRCTDMDNIYAKTKILLVPSLWPEPFGRICIEAMCNGIPCIVSNRGGLPEAIGDAGIIINNPFDTRLWIDAINKLNEDEEFYEEISEKCRERVRRFDFSDTYNNFLETVEERLKITLG